MMTVSPSFPGCRRLVGRAGRRCFGQQLCPWCLRADPEPYLRLTWRLSFVTVCPAHRRLLLDRCPACNEAFSELADPVLPNAAPWGKGRYWKLDGVSSEVKKAARQAAHRAGEGVGPWLDGLLRRELGMPARKTPSARQNADTFAADGVSGCA